MWIWVLFGSVILSFESSSVTRTWVPTYRFRLRNIFCILSFILGKSEDDDKFLLLVIEFFFFLPWLLGNWTAIIRKSKHNGIRKIDNEANEMTVQCTVAVSTLYVSYIF